MSEVYDKLIRCYESVRRQVDFVPEVALGHRPCGAFCLWIRRGGSCSVYAGTCALL